MENLRENEVKEIKNEAVELEKKVESFDIICQDDVKKATGILKVAKEKMSIIKKKMKPIKDATNQAHKEAVRMENELLEPYKNIDRVVRNEISKYQKIEFEKAEKLRREAEFKRLEAERKERERLEKQALKNLENDKIEKAEKLLEKAENVYIPTVTVKEVETQVKSETGAVEMTAKKDIEVEVFDFDLLLNSIIDEKMPKSAIKIQLNEIKKYVKSFDLDEKECKNRGIKKEIVFKTIVR